MIMKRFNISLYSLFIFLSGILLMTGVSSCSRVKQAKNIVISEVMASNRTGLLNHKGKPLDWIELKNTGDADLNLEGFQLAVVKQKVDTLSNDTVTEVSEWEFPAVIIKGGQNLIVFANKKKNKEKMTDDDSGDDRLEKEMLDDDKPKKEKSLRANFNLPKEGAVIRFLSPTGQVLTELTYGKLAPDQSFARKSDGAYEATYLQSPGFDNTEEGFQKATQFMSSQRKDPLRITMATVGVSEGDESWIQLKNSGNEVVELDEYNLSKKLGKNEAYHPLPDVELQPGETVTVIFSGAAPKAGQLSTDFKPGKAGTVVLSKEGKFVDGVCTKLTL